jgi:hypothetical protein
MGQHSWAHRLPHKNDPARGAGWPPRRWSLDAGGSFLLLRYRRPLSTAKCRRTQLCKLARPLHLCLAGLLGIGCRHLRIFRLLLGNALLHHGRLARRMGSARRLLLMRRRRRRRVRASRLIRARGLRRRRRGCIALSRARCSARRCGGILRVRLGHHHRGGRYRKDCC